MRIKLLRIASVVFVCSSFLPVKAHQASVVISGDEITLNGKAKVIGDLQINGVDVQGQINNLGDGVATTAALTSALSALPTTADDAPIFCGVGTGAYSSRVAMGVGCAAKLNKRVSLNVGGSTVFGGSQHYEGGSLDNVAVRGGFVFKLGKIEDATDSNQQLQGKLESLEETNAMINSQNKALLARIERLEAIALGQPHTQSRALSDE